MPDGYYENTMIVNTIDPYPVNGTTYYHHVHATNTTTKTVSNNSALTSSVTDGPEDTYSAATSGGCFTEEHVNRHYHYGSATYGGGCYSAIAHIHSEYGGSCYTAIPHTHSEYGGSCYTAIPHTHSGNETSGGACYTSTSHTHKGDSKNGGECYKKHTHKESTCQHTTSHNYVKGEYHPSYGYYYKCSSCGSAYYERAETGERKTYCTGWTCTKKYDLDCNKTTEYTLSCTKTNDGYTLDCTQTNDGYNLTCSKTIDGYGLSCGYSDGEITSRYYTRTCGHTRGEVVEINIKF